MKTRRTVSVTADEQALLDGVSVRVLEPAEQVRFDALIVAHHYLHNAAWVGARLFHVAEYAGRWLALLSWTAAAYGLKAREAWLGWSPQQRRRRLPLVVNNSRFLILPEVDCANLASRVMRLSVQRLSADWQARYGHGLLAAESFVDPQLFRGTCYQVSGWQQLGQTQGWGRSLEDFYVRHERPKQLWVRELRGGARELLRARVLPDAYRAVEADRPPTCTESAEALRQTCAYFAQVRDWRHKWGDYPCAGLLALVACASLCGVQRGQRDLAAYARTLDSAQLHALGFRKRGHPRRYTPPGETTFFRVLKGVDPRELEQALLAWQDHRLGVRTAEDNVVAGDGKRLCSSQGLETVSLYAVKSGRWLGSEPVAAGSNEIPAAQRLLARTDLEGQRVTLDALHAQQETAHIIVQERGGDYLLPLKGNQPGIVAGLQARCRQGRRAFPPSGTGAAGAAIRNQSQPS